MTLQMRIIARVTFMHAAFLPAHQRVWGEIELPALVAFKSSNRELKRYIWNASGDRALPVVLWNRGSGNRWELKSILTSAQARLFQIPPIA